MTKNKLQPSTYDAVETAIKLSKGDQNSSWGELLRRSNATTSKRRRKFGYKNEHDNEKVAPLPPSVPG